jgi:hypothetical protein
MDIHRCKLFIIITRRCSKLLGFNYLIHITSHLKYISIIDSNSLVITYYDLISHIRFRFKIEKTEVGYKNHSSVIGAFNIWYWSYNWDDVMTAICNYFIDSRRAHRVVMEKKKNLCIKDISERKNKWYTIHQPARATLTPCGFWSYWFILFNWLFSNFIYVLTFWKVVHRIYFPLIFALILQI